MIIKLYLYKILKYFYYKAVKPKLFNTYKNYELSDQKFKFTHILEAINYTRLVMLEPNYFEFGCHSGRTFSSAINSFEFLKINNFEAYAFDSFNGLPDTTNDDGYFEKGTFKTSQKDFIRLIKIYSNYSDKIKIIPGFYENSLTSSLANNLPTPSVIHIDVDLYSSCKIVLNFLKPLLKNGVVILFDDYFCFKPYPISGERRAFEEFLEENPNIVAEEWKSYSTFGKSFFIKII